MLLFAVTTVVWAQEAAALVWEYEGPGGARLASTPEIIAAVLAAPRAEHRVRGNGVDEFTPWQQVPVLAEAWMMTKSGAAAPPEVAAPAPEPGAAPEPTAAPTPAPLPADAPAAPPATVRPAVRVGADVRVGFSAADLQLAGTATGPTAAFGVSRARPIVDAQAGMVSARVAIEARLAVGVPTFLATGSAAYWDVSGREVWVALSGGQTFRHTVTLGLQEPAFGVRRTFEERYPFAGDARADLARKRAILHDEDIGLGWSGRSERWAFDVQLMNGSGATIDANTGKDAIVRIEGSPVDAVTFSASGLFGARGDDGSEQQITGELSLELSGAHQRVLLEGLVGTLSQDHLGAIGYGGGATAAWDIPLVGAVEALSLVGRGSYIDPVFGLDAPDAWWGFGGGGWVAWRALADHPLRTGVTWEMDIPQDSRLPISHDLEVEAVWVF